MARNVLRVAGALLPAAPQRGRRTARCGRGTRLGRAGLHPLRCASLDLRRSAGPSQPHCPRARRRLRPQARQSRAVAQCEQPDDGRVLVCGSEGGRHCRRHDAAAARQGTDLHPAEGRDRARPVRRALGRRDGESQSGRAHLPRHRLFQRRRRWRSATRSRATC